MTLASNDPFDPNDEILESQLVQLTRDLVLIESTDSKPEERRRCFQLVRNHLDELAGIQLNSYFCDEYESLITLPEGISRPDILFCAHLDVVDHLGPEYYQSKHSEGRIYGPGSGDMKGALSILLLLYRNLLSRYPDLSMGLAITSDEERGGERGARYLVEEEGLRAGVVIIPDGGSIDELTVEEKGIVHARARLRGESAHAARPWLGVNSLKLLVSGLQKLESRFHELNSTRLPSETEGDTDHWYPTCSITRIDTRNECINRIPEEATAIFDIRFPNPHQADEMLGILRESLGKEAEVEAIITAEPTHLEPDPKFLEATEKILGKPPRLARVAGGSDARFFRCHGIPVMLSRPIVGNLHGHDEWIDIQSMVSYYRICEEYVIGRRNRKKQEANASSPL